MPYLVRIGRINANVSGVGSRGYAACSRVLGLQSTRE